MSSPFTPSPAHGESTSVPSPNFRLRLKTFLKSRTRTSVSSSATPTSSSRAEWGSSTRGKASEPRTVRSATRVRSSRRFRYRREAEPFRLCSSLGAWMRRGIEFGGDIKKLSLRAAVLNGTLIRWEGEANSFLPFPAQTGPWKGANQATAALTKPFDSPGHSTPDFSANATYILHPDGGGISLIYYHGNVATPTHCTDGTAIGKTNATTGEVCGVTGASTASPFGTVGNTDFDLSSATAFRNNFDRVGVYASYPIGKHFLPQGGLQYGRDTTPVDAGAFPTIPTLKHFDSKGAFAEGSWAFNDYVTAGVRYDWYKPKYAVSTFNTQWAITPYVSIPLQNGFQIIAENQHRDFQLNATNHRQNDTFQARIIFIK